MDYQNLLNRYNEEISSLKSKKAVLESKIDELAKSLGLENNQELEAKARELQLSLQQKQNELQSQLETLLAELESTKCNSDGFEG